MVYLFTGIIISTPLGKLIANQMREWIGSYIKCKQVFAIAYDVIMVGVFIICVIFLVGETYNPFIYFRF